MSRSVLASLWAASTLRPQCHHQTALVTSANLTRHGIGANMELGRLVPDGPRGARLAA